MKKTAIALALMTFPSGGPASAQSCTFASGMMFCAPTYQYHPIAPGIIAGQNLRAQYAMINAYREAHGLPRCAWGLIGAIAHAMDGRPMC